MNPYLPPPTLEKMRASARGTPLQTPSLPSRWRGVIFGAAFLALVFGTPAQAAPLPALLSAPDTVVQQSQRPELAVVRQRPVAINFQQLDPGSGTAATQISVELFDGLTVTLDLERVERRGPDNFSWFGSVQGYAQSHAILTVINGNLAGSIELGPNVPASGGSYQVQPNGNGQHALRQVDQSAFPPDHPPSGAPVAPSLYGKSTQGGADTSGSSQLAATGTTADSGATIDVMIVYSNQTALAAGTAIGAQIQQAIDTTNAVYANSGIATRLNLVHYQQVSYNESGDFPTDLNWLTSNAAVGTLRNTYSADLVSMLVEETQYCGYGWIGPAANYAFSVINRGCASGNYSFPHELGHNFGTRHDTYVDPTTTPYAYGHGWVDTIEGWRDVMAYNNACAAVGKNCTRIPYLSNPNMTYGSPPDPLGTTTTADNARVHNQNALTVANFRLSASGGCSYALSPTSASVGSAATTGSFSVTAGSGCAWNATTSASWLGIGAGSGTSGTGTLNYTVAANSGAARTGTVTVGGQAFTLSQASACVYSLSPTSASVAAGGGTGTTSLSAGTGCAWTAASSAAWLTVTTATSGTGSASVGYAAAANTGSTRSANLTIGGITFVVTQAAATVAPAVATLSPISLNFGNQMVGKTSSARSATITNTGGGTLIIASLAQGGTNPTDFTRTGTCTVNTALLGGQSCTLSYKFTPGATGTRSATLAVNTNANAIGLSLTGTGTPKPGRGK
jgi:hypothetical protein